MRAAVRAALAAAGLAIGILSVVMPFAMQAAIGTQLALASMHVITGQARVDETLGEIRISCDQMISWASTVSSLRAPNSHGYANPDMTTARWCRCE